MTDHAQLCTATMERLRFMRGLLNAVGVECLDTAYGWQLEPTSSVQGPRGKGEVSDPTGAAVLAVANSSEDEADRWNGRRPDPTYRRLRSAMDSLTDACDDIENILRVCDLARGSDAAARMAKDKKSAHTLAPCASVLCEDDSPVGQRHCEACNEYLREHPGVKQVPRKVIAARLRQRTQRERGKLRVSGPHQESVA